MGESADEQMRVRGPLLCDELKRRTDRIANLWNAEIEREPWIHGREHARIVLEYYLLRNALWAFFREVRGQEFRNALAILHVDLAISIATRAALIGYYRPEFEAQGQRPGALERLVDEVPPAWNEP